VVTLYNSGCQLVISVPTWQNLTISISSTPGKPQSSILYY